MSSCVKLFLILSCGVGNLLYGCASSKEAAPAAQGDSADNAEITNNQEAGVDEGGIVKNIGEHLVLLRGGQLFAAKVSGKPEQTGRIRVARAAELKERVWYDEMLVQGRDIYVVGFRYSVILEHEGILWDSTKTTGATEVSHFKLTERGRFERLETVFFESNDYYDPSNYASRMIKGNLVFYIPLYASHEDDKLPGREELPTMLRYRGGGRFERMEPLLSPAKIQKGGIKGQNILHVVVNCRVEKGLAKGCSSKGLSAPWMSTRYVTGQDVFLWGADNVWAFSLIDGSITNHRARGIPLDQFGFKYDAVDQVLRVIAFEHETQNFELLEFDRGAFTTGLNQELAPRSEVISAAARHWRTKARFIGQDHVVLALPGDQEGFTLVGHSFRGISHTQRLHEVPKGYPSRLESIGKGRALVASSEYDGSQAVLRLMSLDLRAEASEAQPRVLGELKLAGLGEGEDRSHGFFYSQRESEGVFGLPVVGGAGGGGWWGRGAASVAFFGVSQAGALELRGAVSASEGAEDSCVSSCIDWYGNTRPIFLGEKVFALMGAELAQVRVEKAAVRVVHRLVLK